jgi:serine/threonine protein kinase
MQFALEEDAAVTLPAARRLLELLDVLGRPAASPPPAEEILRLCDELEAAGHGRRAQELLERLCALLPDPELRLQLARLLHRGKDWARAIELLHELTQDPGCRLEAHFLLGDYHGQQAEAARALEHYEAVLALDYSYPRAASRVAELRERLDQPLATSAPTILGAEDLGRSNRFLLQRELGRGGSGTVYLALDRGLGRAVAVKALHRQVEKRPDARAHLFCEARIASALQHPGIVAIYDLDEELNLVVMEYCAGGTLAEQLSAHAPPALVLALDRLAEVASTLDTVHRCGVVHRDLKPANLLFRRAAASGGIPPLTITDFGIAHAGRAEDEDPAVRAAGSLLYMAPEQRDGSQSDPRADLYSLGVIALELILGRPPLTAHEALQGCAPLEADEPWRALRDALPRQAGSGLLELLRALLDPAVGARPANAAEVARRLETVARQAALAEDRRAAYLELQDRAGPPQARAAVVERWLDERRAELVE